MMCFSNPWTLVPMVVTSVQPVIAAGGIRPSDQLVDVRSRAVPGTITVFMEPVYDGGADKIRPGSKCIANLYTSTKARLGQGDLSTMQKVGLTVVDGVALLQALIIRAHALIYPVRLLFAEKRAGRLAPVGASNPT